MKNEDCLFESHLLEIRGEKTIYEERDGERVGLLTYVTDRENTELYIREIFVKREYRRSRVAFSLGENAEKIAKNLGCKVLAGTIVRGTYGQTQSMQTMLSFGFKIHDWDVNRIVLLKEVPA